MVVTKMMGYKGKSIGLVLAYLAEAWYPFGRGCCCGQGSVPVSWGCGCVQGSVGRVGQGYLVGGEVWGMGGRGWTEGGIFLGVDIVHTEQSKRKLLSRRDPKILKSWAANP